jgi:hypothetical protein
MNRETLLVELAFVALIAWPLYRYLRLRWWATARRRHREYLDWIDSHRPKNAVSDDDYEDEPDSPEVARARKYLRGHYICTVRPEKRMVYDFRKRRQVKLPPWSGSIGMGEKRTWPLIGFACPDCHTFNNYSRHYLVEKRSICEECAIPIVMKKLGLKERTDQHAEREP